MSTEDIGTFILSWDCEGKWGVADQIGEHHRTNFTNERIRLAYLQILALLADVRLSASFAFVGALTLAPQQYPQFARTFGDTPLARLWLRNFDQDAARGDFEGWFVPGLVEMVLAEGVHEVCSHGFTHLPLGEAETGAEDAERELRMAVEVARLLGVTPRTFVFPRNRVGHTELLAQHGFLAYRGGVPDCGKLSRFTRLASEFNVFSGSQRHAVESRRPLCLPGGTFFNWRCGIRRHVPTGVTIARWKSIVRDAVNRRWVVHLWLHPHNLIDGEGELAVLAEVLNYASSRVKSGSLRNLTQLNYTLDRVTEEN